MKKLNSRNKKIKWFHEITGLSFSKCRQKLREKGNLDKVCEEYFLLKMSSVDDELSDGEKLMGNIQYVKMSGVRMTTKLHALEHIADKVICELNDMCVEGKWFKCTNAYFADDYQWITLDIIDSDFRRVAAEVVIDNAELLLDHDEQNYVIKRLVEDTLGGYIESDYFEWD